MSMKGKEHERREARRELNYDVADEIADAVRASKGFSRVSGPNRERGNDEFSLGYFIAFEGYEYEMGATRPVFYSITVKDVASPSGIVVRRTPMGTGTAEQRAKLEALEQTAEEIRAAHAKQKRRRRP